MIKFTRIGLPILVLAGCVAVGATLITTAPEAERQPPAPSLPVVEVMEAVPGSYPVGLDSRGTVSPRTQSSLSAEVSGRVVKVADELRNGGFFEPGQVLLEIDARDYANDVTVARSELAQARLDLEEELARAEQAKQDWARLDLEGQPDKLALRRPQLASARAKVAAAEARLEQAEVDLQRTRIKAPYAGRVLEKNVGVGQYLTAGTELATIYAVDYVEIRLPLSNRQLRYIDLPERYRNSDSAPTPIPAQINARIGTRTYTWPGGIVRTEGDIDTDTRQWFVVAQVDDPYARRDGRPPLKVGQFVSAMIQGTTLEDVYILPRVSLQQGGEVAIVTAEGTIRRQPVEVLWETHEKVVVRGLAPGDEIVVSAAISAVDGTRVQVAGEKAPRSDRQQAAREEREESD